MTGSDFVLIKKFLNSQRLMTLATYSQKPWVATVYYVTDKDLNLYFVSSPNSKHCQDIEKNKHVACAIYDSHTPNSELKVGIQLQGEAGLVKGWDKTKVLLKMWHKAAPGAEDVVNIKNMKNKIVTPRVYKIKPTMIKFFNQRLYKEKEEKVFKLV